MWDTYELQPQQHESGKEQCSLPLYRALPSGAGDGTRTRSPLLGKQMRYHCATPARAIILRVSFGLVKHPTARLQCFVRFIRSPVEAICGLLREVLGKLASCLAEEVSHEADA